MKWKKSGSNQSTASRKKKVTDGIVWTRIVSENRVTVDPLSCTPCRVCTAKKKKQQRDQVLLLWFCLFFSGGMFSRAARRKRAANEDGGNILKRFWNGLAREIRRRLQHSAGNALLDSISFPNPHRGPVKQGKKNCLHLLRYKKVGRLFLILMKQKEPVFFPMLFWLYVMALISFPCTNS